MTVSLTFGAATANADEPYFLLDMTAPEETPCLLPGADEDGNLIVGGIGEVVILVENDNHMILKCMGKDITNLSGKGQHFEGFECFIDVDGDGVADVSTFDTHATVSKSGVSSLTCKVTY